jgi:AcrR family transcriptional regulator
MQVKKSEIRKEILNTARKEFLKHGFQGTTMRVIARKSGITTSNIYNYFKNKDHLFIELVKPTTKKIISALDRMDQFKTEGDSVIWDYQNKKLQFEEIIAFIDSHRQDLNLILFKSFGSSIQDFKEEFIERYTDIYLKHLKELHDIHPGSRTVPSYFFIHNLCSMYANVIGECIMHNISYKKMKEYSEEFLIFLFFGEKALGGWKNDS